jgi:membrane protease YdiL (CAAX protease family)
MDATSTLIFFAVVLGVLLVVACFPEINRLMERTVSPKAILRATVLRDILLAIFGVILAELWRALFVLRDWALSLSFALVSVVIIVFIINLRHISEYRQQWMNRQSTRNLAVLIKLAVKEALKEGREENIVSMKDAFKQALKEDREETNNSKRDSQ